MSAKKGGEFERQIAKQLSLWFSKGEKDDIFWRTSGSGARATTRMKKGKGTSNSAGDLGLIHPKGKPFLDLCLVEIKRGYNRKKTSLGKQISVLSLLDTPKGRKTKPILFRWWDKAEAERSSHLRKYSLIIFRRDRHKACICMAQNTFELLDKYAEKPFTFPHDGTWVHVQIDGYSLRIFLLDEFLKWCKPRYFHRRITRRKKI